METEDLILRLAREVKPVRARAVEMRLLGSVAAGAAVAFGALCLTLGAPADLPAAVASFPFWMKAAYTASIAAAAIVIAADLARPDSRPKRWYALLIAPIFLLAILASAQLATSPAAEWPELFLGVSASKCSIRILGFSTPVFLGLIWAFRRFAPTRLRAAGAAAGLAAGAVGAAIYALHCREASASFVLSWYTLGILLPALAGALIGPRLLRW